MSDPEKTDSIVERAQELVLRSLAFIGLKGSGHNVMPVPSVLTEGQDPIVVVPADLGDKLLGSIDFRRIGTE